MKLKFFLSFLLSLLSLLSLFSFSMSINTFDETKNDIILGEISIENNQIENENEQQSLPIDLKLYLNIGNSSNFVFKLKKNNELFHPNYSIERWTKNGESKSIEKRSLERNKYVDCFYDGFFLSEDENEKQTNIILSFCSNSIDGLIQFPKNQRLYWISTPFDVFKRNSIPITLQPQTSKSLLSEFDILLEKSKRVDSFPAFQETTTITTNINETIEYPLVSNLWPKVLIVNDGFRFSERGEKTEIHSALLLQIANTIYSNSIGILNVTVKFVLMKQITIESEEWPTPWFKHNDKENPLNGVLTGLKKKLIN